MRLPEIGVQDKESFVIATLHGACDVDLLNASELGAVLVDLVPASSRGLVVDLTSVDYVDSSAVRMVFGLLRRLEGRGQSLGLVVPQRGAIRRVLSVTRVDDVVVVEACLEACLRVLDARHPER